LRDEWAVPPILRIAEVHLVPTSSHERFFVGTRKTDDGDAGGIAEEV
jgi:hypothetical protein